MAQAQAGSATRSPTLYYIGPFCVFLGLLVLSRNLPAPPLAAQTSFVAIMLVIMAVLVPQAAPAEYWRVRNWTGSLFLGALVFAIWIVPDQLFPGYRHHWMFENSVMGTLQTSLPQSALKNTEVLWLRGFRAVGIVPIVEELFWRGWLMRWIISPRFENIPLGAWSAQSFCLVALLFGADHGPYWDVGLAAGVLYNWWMLRARSLGDLVVAHMVTNALLSVYVVWSGKWEYWL